MNAIKGWLNKEIERIKNIQDGAELYVIFFRATQLFTVISGIYMVFVLIPVYMNMPTLPPELLVQPELHSAWRTVYSSMAFSVGTILIWIIAAEVALRLMDKNSLAGWYIGLVISLFNLPSLYFLVGLFGLYALLNKSAQQRFLTEAPIWLKDLLKALSIDYTRSNQPQ